MISAFWNFSLITSTIFWNFDDVERCVKFLILNLLFELLPIFRFTSHKTRPGNRWVIFQSHARRPRSKRRTSAQCSSYSHQAIRALLRISTSQTAAAPCSSLVCTDYGMYPKGRTPVLHSYSVTNILRSSCCFNTVATAVVTGSTLCFFTVSLSLSLFVPVLGSGLVVYLQVLFASRLGHDAVLRTFSVQYNRHGCMAHHPLGVTRVQIHPVPAVARRTCDVLSKRLEHPPLASMRAIMTDGSRAPPST